MPNSNAAEPDVSDSGHDLNPLDAGDRESRIAQLNDEERRVILHQGTEAPFCGGLLDNKLHGVYRCRLCELPLFSSEAKFNSGTGWPSFSRPFDPKHVRTVRDIGHGMIRDEIRCARCDGHLGHVFDDGPPPTGQRYCLNSVSLTFVEATEVKP
ncbi:MAG: peptide-methionine (R)-S-oxide reductase [Hydrogenophilales bacterium 28-61-23]|nr:MAG: peptide-methionine (R)-S-oxide reductase [Hydrogenophilales bacterium 28-61-23]